MARKNIFEDINDTTPTGDLASEPKAGERPLAGLDRGRTSTRPSALGAISQSLEKINERAERADEIERQLHSGQAIVELDPDLIDNSFIADRLEFDAEDQQKLLEQIRESGQMVPILVRPHPTTSGRFQIAYGHRRVAVVKALGRKVRAIVKPLTDEQLVIHQGQENNTRSDLSFIERAFFVSALEQQGFTRDTIYRSTGIDKAILSRMTIIVKSIPDDILRKIGRAPTIGRTRWNEFVELIAKPTGPKLADKAVNAPTFEQMSSDERFQSVFAQLKKPVQQAGLAEKSTFKVAVANGLQPLTVTKSGRKTQFTFDEKLAPDFADFIQSRLPDLYAAYATGKPRS